VLLGVSAGTYGLFLAGATGLQAAADRAEATGRAPTAQALAELTVAHDLLESSLDEALARYGEAGDAYRTLVDAIAAYGARIADLASRVDGVSTEAAGLPGAVATPRPAARTKTSTGKSPIAARQLTTVTTPIAAPKPAATATTGASGR
jgi:hypothetical protein